ncbi:MAG: hypothetical protein AUJ12_02110 [Alphaproteobacteria bacterium CG1_02_46_17]|nr:MAG: hypothetical protein AUJ12_02110 [Alphaproteobacteria bacterium CG1_02_46_17]
MRNKKRIDKKPGVDSLSVSVREVVGELIKAGFTCVTEGGEKNSGVRTSRIPSAKETCAVFNELAQQKLSEIRKAAQSSLSIALGRGNVGDDVLRGLRAEYNRVQAMTPMDVLDVSNGGRRMKFSGFHVETGRPAEFLVAPCGHMRGTELEALRVETGINLLHLPTGEAVLSRQAGRERDFC